MNEFQLVRGAFLGRRDVIEWFETMPGETMAIRVDSALVDGAFSIVEANVPALSGPPAHFHKNREEIFEVLDGIFRFQCGDDVFDASVGTTVVVPRGVRHSWMNMGPERARILFTFVPGGIDDFFRQIGKTPPAGWEKLAEQHDTWIIGPPIADGAAAPSI